MFAIRNLLSGWCDIGGRMIWKKRSDEKSALMLSSRRSSVTSADLPVLAVFYIEGSRLLRDASRFAKTLPHVQWKLFRCTDGVLLRVRMVFDDAWDAVLVPNSHMRPTDMEMIGIHSLVASQVYTAPAFQVRFSTLRLYAAIIANCKDTLGRLLRFASSPCIVVNIRIVSMVIRVCLILAATGAIGARIMTAFDFYGKIEFPRSLSKSVDRDDGLSDEEWKTVLESLIDNTSPRVINLALSENHVPTALERRLSSSSGRWTVEALTCRRPVMKVGSCVIAMVNCRSDPTIDIVVVMDGDCNGASHEASSPASKSFEKNALDAVTSAVLEGIIHSPSEDAQRLMPEYAVYPALEATPHCGVRFQLADLERANLRGMHVGSSCVCAFSMSASSRERT